MSARPAFADLGSSLVGMPAHDVVWQPPRVQRGEREQAAGHRAAVLWLTGLSGAGKSTLAQALDAELHAAGRRSYVLDGDNLRHGLCADLGFTPEARRENLRRAAEAARLLADAGVIVLAAFISPLRADRALVRSIVGAADFIEVHVDCPLAECERRDVKGLYRRARAGAVPHFTGISAPYEAPEAADCVVRSGEQGLAAGVRQLRAVLEGRIALR